MVEEPPGDAIYGKTDAAAPSHLSIQAKSMQINSPHQEVENQIRFEFDRSDHSNNRFDMIF